MTDYYAILQLSPSANQKEIKAAYRRLAHLYHPDKKPGDKYALAQFNLVKEAYETLTNPVLKNKYLQERWLYKSTAVGFTTHHRTPDAILQRCIEYYHHSNALDEHRMDKKKMYGEFSRILNEENMNILNEFADTTINHQLIAICIKAMNVLNIKDQEKIVTRLFAIQVTSKSKLLLKEKHKEIAQQLFWLRYRFIFVFLVVIFVCLLIWFSGKK